MAEVLPSAWQEFREWISQRKAGTGGGTALVPISSAKMPANSLTGAQSQEIAVLAGALQEHGMSTEEAALLAVDLAEIRQNAGRDTQMLTEKEFYEAFEKGFNYDIMQEIRENYSDELKEELNSGRAREESKENFLSRGNREGMGIYEGQTATYGFQRVGHSTESGYYRTTERVAQTSIEAQKELNSLGINSDIIDGRIWINNHGITKSKFVPEAATIEDSCIVINSNSTLNGKEVAGHEAFHYWNSGNLRKEYTEILMDNLIFTSPDFLKFQDAIAQGYFGEEVDLANGAQMSKLQEEIFAYISGRIHAGIYDAQLRPMFRNYDAVKAAWYELIRKNR